MEKRIYEPKFYTDEKLRGKSGIYQIRNIINNKFYIGSTKNILRRKYEHIYDLRTMNHHNVRLQRAFNKYGKENFIFEIIEFIEDKDELLKVEQYWIDKFFGQSYFYNENPSVNLLPVLNKKSIYCIELNREFESIERAGIDLNLNPPNISAALKNINRTCGTYHWIYTSDKENFSNEDLQTIIKKKNGRLQQPIICLDDNIVYFNYKDICDTYNIKYSITIYRCCIGRNKSSNGYHFMFLEDYKKSTLEDIKKKKSYYNKRRIYCVTTGENFNSIADACRKYHLHSSGIINCCQNKITNTKGFVFKYIDICNILC